VRVGGIGGHRVDELGEQAGDVREVAALAHEQARDDLVRVRVRGRVRGRVSP